MSSQANIYMVIREIIREEEDENCFVCYNCKLISDPCLVVWCKSGTCCCQGHTEEE
jgi:hypothetical protein